MRILRTLCLALTALLISLPSAAKPLQPDPNWTIQKLDNGFQYRLYSVDESSDRVQLYLWVKSGSADETAEQKGGAHLLEHMAFNGTKHFPGHKIEQLFKEAGLGFGQDINAYTNFKETVYTLNIPDNNPELMNDVLLYLSDVAQNIELDETEVAKEIGVVKGEYYTRLSYEQIKENAYMDKMSAGTEYILNNIGGLPAQLDTLNANKLQDYYRAWYRPDNMELLVVGKIDKPQISQAIAKQFNRLHGQAKTKNRPAEPQFSHATQTFSSVEVKQNGVSLNFILPPVSVATEADTKINNKIEFTHLLIMNRLNRAHELSGTPFASINSYVGLPMWVGNNRVYSLEVEYRLSQDQAAIDWLGAEIAKINQFGFTQAEFDQLKQLYSLHIANYDQTYDNLTSSNIINNYLGALKAEQVPVDKKTTLLLYNDFLEQLTLAEVNQFAQQTLVNPQIYQVAPEMGEESPLNAGVLKSHQQLESWVTAALKQSVQPYAAGVLVAQQTDDTLATATGKLLSQQSYKELGIEQLNFDNGLSVLLQPDSTKKGMVYFQFSAPGGITSLDAKYRSAANMLIDTQINSGLGKQSAQQVQQALASHLTTVNPFINNSAQGFDGSMPTAQLDFALTLLKRGFVSDKIDPAAFKQVKEGIFNNVKNYLNSNQGQVDIRYFNALYGKNPYEGPLSLKQIEQVTTADLLYVKQQLFGSANGFKLTLVGDFEIDEAKALISQHLATLPKGTQHQASPQTLWATKNKTEINENRNDNDRADIVFQFVYQGVEPSEKQIYATDLISRIISEQLMATVREDLSLAYSPYAGCDPASDNINYSYCRIAFVTAPQDADKAKQAVEKILTQLYQTGADNKALSLHKNALETAMLDTFKDPQSRAWFIHRDFVSGYQVGEVLDPKAIVASIDKPYIDGLIKQMLQNAGQLTLVNLPK
ncbi:insulinase family protein [Motilimonas cestriensis]|uniref:Insulinase family protein n=1 Tax=Motilimonas cestriensis TaxID=2742685 RepID=A0ABS8WF23_9GAMM|nr:M16 family metallopeptidase [Motilimonas cestriensis]MCE2596927.1 insulinase family protein [Motilimonas cestriensis]